MLIVDVDPLCTASLVLSSFCPYLYLSFCPCHLVLSPSYCLLNLHPPKNRKQYRHCQGDTFYVLFTDCCGVLKYVLSILLGRHMF